MERFPAYDWQKCLHLDMVHFFGMARYLKMHPVPVARMVELESEPEYIRPNSDTEDDDMPPPADQPQDVEELVAWLNRG